MSYGKIKQYLCGFCKNQFEAMAKATGGATNQFGNRIRVQSNTITCPKCQNNQKTWDDKVEREVTRMQQKG